MAAQLVFRASGMAGEGAASVARKATVEASKAEVAAFVDFTKVLFVARGACRGLAIVCAAAARGACRGLAVVRGAVARGLCRGLAVVCGAVGSVADAAYTWGRGFIRYLLSPSGPKVPRHEAERRSSSPSTSTATLTAQLRSSSTTPPKGRCLECEAAGAGRRQQRRFTPAPAALRWLLVQHATTVPVVGSSWSPWFSFIRALPWHCQTCTVLVIREDCAKQVNNFSGNIYKGYASREVAEEKWRRHGRKKWRNFIVIITALLLSMAGRLCALLSPKLARAPSSEL